MATKTLRQIAGLLPATNLQASQAALVLIDLQMDYFKGDRLYIPGGAAVVDTALKLRAWAHQHGITVIHVQQLSSSRAPIFAEGSSGSAIHPSLTPQSNEVLVTKRLPCSFKDTILQHELDERGINTLVIAGLMTHMCVDSTTREAVHLGYRCIVVSDGCASRDLPSAVDHSVISHIDIHRATLAALADRFADIMTASEVTSLSIT